MPVALMCPGQGAQHVGMGKDFYEAFPTAKGVFDTADRVLGFALTKFCFEGPEDKLNATDVAQLAIFTTGVAIYQTMKELGKLPTQPAYAAGLSLGEYTALHLAGAFSFEDGLKIVRSRGQLMQAAAEAAPSTMLALVGAEEAQAEEICKEAASDGILVPANFNSPGQIVLSGSFPACEKAQKVAEAKGLRAIPLKVAGAFHSPFMQSAADKMAEVLAGVDIKTPAIPVISNVTTQPHGDPESIRKLLVQQIVAPVKWYQSIATLQKLGATEWLEIGPGRVLTGLMKKIDRRAAMTNVSAADGLK